jgi:ribose/xylose/arabinose/galactoside ABC-type transport system permease subunit
LKRSSTLSGIGVKILSIREIGIIVATIVLALAFQALNPIFLTFGFFVIVLAFASRVGIVASGMTLLMGSGEFDLSIGSVFALIPTIAFLLFESGVNIWIALAGAFGASILCGLFNGFIVVRMRIPSFISTLGMMFAYETIALILTAGGSKESPPVASFQWIFGRGEPYHVPVLVIWWLAVTAACYVLLGKTKHGNWSLATGGNREAARAMGVNTGAVKVKNFILTSALAGLAGTLYATRMNAVYAIFGQGLELTVIGAVAIGGTSLFGGSATILGTAIASVLLGMVYLGLVTVLPSTVSFGGIANIPPMYLYEGGAGAIIVIMSLVNVTLDRMRASRRLS